MVACLLNDETEKQNCERLKKIWCVFRQIRVRNKDIIK